MTRALYRCLVCLHPPFFRREFAGEMLWIYDATVESVGIRPLFFDAFVSLARQWCLRSGYWKYFVAPLGAVFQLSLAGLLLSGIGRGPARSTFSGTENPELAALMNLAAGTAVGLVACIMFLVFWWRKLARRIEV